MMLSRTTTLANAAAIVVLAVPIVWAVGYQDHPWRDSTLAFSASGVLIAAALAVHVAGAREDPAVSRTLTASAIVAAVGSLGCALVWAWFG